MEWRHIKSPACLCVSVHVPPPVTFEPIGTGYLYRVVSYKVSQTLWPFLIYCASPSEF